MHQLFLLLACITVVACSPNYCCPNNTVVHRHGKCEDGKRTVMAALCDQGAYIISPDMDESEEYKVEVDDTLTILRTGYSVERDKYCIGKLIEDNTTIDMALVCFTDTDDDNGTTLGVFVTSICCFISIIFLAATLVVYFILPNMRDLQGKILIFSITSLLLAFLFLASVQIKNNYGKTACVTMACLIYFWFLCVFFWLNVVSFNVWRSVARPKWLISKNRLFLIYNIYAWGGPTVFLISALIAHHSPGEHIKPQFGVMTCWFQGDTALWAYFYGPISVLLLTNAVMFIMTAVALYKNSKTEEQNMKVQSQKFKCMLYLKLFFIMGLAWLFEPLSHLFAKEAHYLWMVTDYINSLQGILIFLLLVVFRKRVRRELARKGLCCLHFPQTWAVLRDEDCQELEEDADDISSTKPTNVLTET